MKDDSKETLTTLLSLMVDLWQECYGAPSRHGYQNKQRAEKMMCVGLQPVVKGKPRKITGQNVTYRIINGGCFDSFIRETSFQIKYYSETPKPEEAKETRVRYTCSCYNNVWGKAGLTIICGHCNRPYQPRQHKNASTSAPWRAEIELKTSVLYNTNIIYANN